MKIEQEFHIGEWIVNNGHSYLIAGIDYLDNKYLFETEGYTHEQLNWEYIENVDGKYHKWTIEDAKDGDVLVTISERPFIYKGCLDTVHPNSPVAYCGIIIEGYFQPSYCTDFWWTNEEVHPATKEQCDLLFKKMHEEGYEWDTEKRELKKTENSEYHTPKFEIGDVMRTLQEAAEGMTDGMPVIIAIDKDYYHCNNELIAIKDQDDYEYPPMNKRQKTKDKVIVTLIENVKNEIINDTRNPYTAHGHEVLMELLAAYNYYQETERNGVNYIFNIENNDDVIRCMKGGMTSKEVCDLYTASQSTHTKYFYYGYNDNGARQISTMDELRTNIIAWLDEIVTCVINY